MRLAHLQTCAFDGLSFVPAAVEVAMRPGLASLHLVGLPGRSVRESKERVLTALRAIGVKLPAMNMVVNLSPGELRKEGTHYDLPIALALLQAAGHLPRELFRQVMAAGELGLDGSLHSFRGTVGVAVAAQAAGQSLLIPLAALPETSVVRPLRQRAYGHLQELVEEAARGEIPFQQHGPALPPLSVEAQEWEEIEGLSWAKRAALLAAAGWHHLLLSGPPGVGKSMLGRSLVDLLPRLSHEGLVEAAVVHSGAGTLSVSDPLLRGRPPCRQPHHTATAAAVLGSLTWPGEMALAHRGVLLIDELPLFSSDVIQSLREPLESGRLAIGRAGGAVTRAADCLVVGTYNPCPCGFRGDPAVRCACSAAAIERYRRALSGPILSRFALFSSCAPTSRAEPATSWQEARAQVVRARERQAARQGELLNGRAPATVVKEWVERSRLAVYWRELRLEYGLSWRSAVQAGRVARTIADLTGNDLITKDQLAEAVAWLPPPVLTSREY